MNSIAPLLALFTGGFGWAEMLILGLLGVVIFGKRLPEVGRSVGRGIVEFKKGLAGVDDEVEDAKSKQKARELESKSGDEAAKVTTQAPEREEMPG